MAEIRGNYRWRRRCGTKTDRCVFPVLIRAGGDAGRIPPLVLFAIFDFGRDTSCASTEIVYVTRYVSRSVCFSTQVRFLCGGLAALSFASHPTVLSATHARPAHFHSEGNQIGSASCGERGWQSV